MSRDDIPEWLSRSQAYEPIVDREGFITSSILQVSSALAQLRLDNGREARWSPSAPVKLACCLACVLLTSLSRNYLFVLVMLAIVLVRACLLPAAALRRVASITGAAAGLALVMTLPAALIGQPRAALAITTKSVVSVGLVMEVALTTPAARLTGALRAYHVPSLVILTLDIALRGVVSLGTVAHEALEALRLRSVGRNADKAGSIGGVGGIVLVKAGLSAHETYDAMRCRGFVGEYGATGQAAPHATDAAWLLALALLLALFARLQGAM